MNQMMSNGIVADEENYEAEDYEDRHVEVQELRAQNTNIPLAHLDTLLGILRQRLLPELSRSVKTFLRTNIDVKYNIRKIDGENNHDGGLFWHCRIPPKMINVLQIIL